MFTKIHHTGITVTNYGRSLKFYRDTLGLQVVTEIEFDRSPSAQTIHALKNERFRLSFLAVPEDLGGGMIELFYFLSPKGVKARRRHRVCDHGWTHICFLTNDIDKQYKQLKAKGVKFTTPPIQVQTTGIRVPRRPKTEMAPTMGQVRATYFYDPDGLILEMIQL